MRRRWNAVIAGLALAACQAKPLPEDAYERATTCSVLMFASLGGVSSALGTQTPFDREMKLAQNEMSKALYGRSFEETYEAARLEMNRLAQARGLTEQQRTQNMLQVFERLRTDYPNLVRESASQQSGVIDLTPMSKDAEREADRLGDVTEACMRAYDTRGEMRPAR